MPGDLFHLDLVCLLVRPSLLNLSSAVAKATTDTVCLAPCSLDLFYVRSGTNGHKKGARIEIQPRN